MVDTPGARDPGENSDSIPTPDDEFDPQCVGQSPHASLFVPESLVLRTYPEIDDSKVADEKLAATLLIQSSLQRQRLRKKTEPSPARRRAIDGRRTTPTHVAACGSGVDRPASAPAGLTAGVDHTAGARVGAAALGGSRATLSCSARPRRAWPLDIATARRDRSADGGSPEGHDHEAGHATRWTREGGASLGPVSPQNGQRGSPARMWRRQLAHGTRGRWVMVRSDQGVRQEARRSIEKLRYRMALQEALVFAPSAHEARGSEAPAHGDDNTDCCQGAGTD